MSNSQKIVPSLSKRKVYLLFSSKSFLRNLWVAIGAIIIIIGIILTICLRDREIPSYENEVITEYTDGYIIGLCIVGIGIINIVVGCLIVPLFMKLLKVGEIQYPIAKVQIPKTELLQMANTDFNLSDSKIQIEVIGDWIDVSINWKNCVSFAPTRIYVDQSLYKKMISLKDDYTYQELDFEGIGKIDISLGSFYIEKGFRCGKITHHQIEYNFGIDIDSGNTGINKYTLSTIDISNEIHKWLADHGYRPRD